MNQKTINLFTSSTSKVLNDLLDIHCFPCEVLRQPVNYDKPFDVGAQLILTGSVLDGTFTLCFSKEVYLKITSKVYNLPFSDLEPNIAKTALQFLDMIIDLSRKEIKESKLVLSPHKPKLYLGSTEVSDFYVGQHRAKSLFVIPFSSKYGDFEIQLADYSEESTKQEDLH